MTEIRFNEPPPPPDGLGWCLPCLMKAKERIVDRHPDLAAMLKDGKDEIRHVAWDDRLMVRPAMVAGICDWPQLGRVPVCFNHLVFFRQAPGGGLLTGQIPPGLARGGG